MARHPLSLIVDALALSEHDPEARTLATAFGGDPVEVRERLIGAPAVRSRRMLFASGGEIILHDDAVVAVLLHLVPTPVAPVGIDLASWIPGVGNDATLDDLKRAIDAPRRFAGLGTPYFPLEGCFLRADFRNRRGWNEPGNLVVIAVTVEAPGLSCAPDDDDCRQCSELLIRGSDSGGVDVDATVAALVRARDAGLLTEDLHWVRINDLRSVHASGLMERAESQLTCTACGRIICITLHRDAPATFAYNALNDARRRPMEAIPPVAHWGDETRIAEDHDAMHYVDHLPGGWFLVERHGEFYLDARYVVNSMVDDSALIRLDENELDQYRSGGHDYLCALAMRINDNGPHRDESPYRDRDLRRGPDGKAYRDAVAAAIVNHTWLAERRRSG